MGLSHIKDTKQWKEMQSKLEEMGKEALLKEQVEKPELVETIEKIEKETNEAFTYHELNETNYGNKNVSKPEFHRLAKQLTEWGVWNSGSVIKKEGPLNVKLAVALTLACTDKIKNPGAYFRKVLKNLQDSFLRECN